LPLSIVIPIFNEEESLPSLCEEIRDAPGLGKEIDYEILLVDDGSTDRSAQIIEGCCTQTPHIRGIFLRGRQGKAAALAAGFHHARGDRVVTLDADLQDDPAEIPNLLRKLEEGYDLVCGWKQNRADPIGKTIPSLVFNGLTRLTTDLKIHDMNCGLKAFRREVCRSVPLYGELHRFIPLLASWQHYRVTELPVHHRPRKYGRSKYGISRFWKGWIDLCTTLFLVRFSTRPGHFFGGIGFLSGAAGFGTALYLSYIRIMTGTFQARHPLLLMSVLLMIVGIQFISIGFVAELLLQLRHPPATPHHIRKIIPEPPS
jgi:glycosyltransferase involved in cell wall biosynthesis